MRARWVLGCCLDGLSVTGIAGRFARSVKAIRLQKRCIFRKLGLHTDTGRFRIRHALEGQASAVPPAAFGEALRGGGRRAVRCVPDPIPASPEAGHAPGMRGRRRYALCSTRSRRFSNCLTSACVNPRSRWFRTSTISGRISGYSERP